MLNWMDSLYGRSLMRMSSFTDEKSSVHRSIPAALTVIGMTIAQSITAQESTQALIDLLTKEDE